MLDTESLKAKAKLLGFSFIGFSDATQTPHYPQFLAQVKEKALGNLHFLQEDYVIAGRKSPSSLLEGAQTTIVLGAAYEAAKTITNRKESGFIAAYAQYPDYHIELRNRAKQLIQDLNIHRGTAIKARFFIDSGPMMEKDMFYKAGLGQIGKHTIAIHPNFGSFFLICCILLDEVIEIHTSDSFDLCDKCEICRKACPTKCIDNYSINPMQCISYQTIENRSIIPRDLRKATGNHIFGCDICQIVCPLNKDTHLSKDSIFSGDKKIIQPYVDLGEEIQFSEKQFHTKYAKTPVSRLSFVQYKRNIINAIGNSKNDSFFNCLLPYLSHPSEILRSHAAWSMAEIDRQRSQPILQERLEKESDPAVQREIQDSLKQLSG